MSGLVALVVPMPGSNACGGGSMVVGRGLARGLVGSCGAGVWICGAVSERPQIRAVRYPSRFRSAVAQNNRAARPRAWMNPICRRPVPRQSFKLTNARSYWRSFRNETTRIETQAKDWPTGPRASSRLATIPPLPQAASQNARAKVPTTPDIRFYWRAFADQKNKAERANKPAC